MNNNAKQKKDLLFYSDFCNHSRNIINLVNKYNLKNSFMLISLEKYGSNIPKIVSSVPTIITVNKNVLTDDQVEKYIDSLKPVVKDEISPFSLITGIGDQFSQLDDSGNYISNQADNTNGDSGQGWALINNNIEISPPEDTKKTGRFDDTVLNDYMARRNMDDEKIKNAIGINRI